MQGGAAALLLVFASAAPGHAGLLDGAPREAVTTGINDTNPTSPWASVFLKDLKPASVRSTRFGPGYYRLRLQSYCLHAGTYGPTQGDGYLLAPIKGDRAGLISSILVRSVTHPEIQQDDIQRLLWGIEAYTPFADYPGDFQQRVRPLLNEGEISSMGANQDVVKNAVGGFLQSLLPSEISNAISQVQTWRNDLTNPTMAFPELAQLAVLSGPAPVGEGSRPSVEGQWSYVGNGAYIRFFPESYQITDVEIFKAPAYRLTTDSIGRVTELVMGGSRIKATYVSTPDVIRVDGGTVRPWRFRTLEVTGSRAGEHAIIRNRGWVLDSRDVRFTPGGSSVHVSAAAPEQIASLPQMRLADAGDAVVNGVERVYDAKGKYDQASSLPDAAGKNPDAQKAGEDLTSVENLAGGLHDIAKDGEGGAWGFIIGVYQNVAIVVAGTASVLSGDGAQAGSHNGAAGNDDMNYPVLAQPNNSSQQRLGVSWRSAAQ